MRLPDDSEFCHYCGAKIDISGDIYRVEENSTSLELPAAETIVRSTGDAVQELSLTVENADTIQPEKAEVRNL